LVCGGVHLRSLAADPGRRRKRTSTFFQGVFDRFSFIPFGKAWVRPLGSPSFPWVWFLVLRPCCWETSVDGSGLMVGSIDRSGVSLGSVGGWDGSPIPSGSHPSRIPSIESWLDLSGPVSKGTRFPFQGSLPPDQPGWVRSRRKGWGWLWGIDRAIHPPRGGGANRRGNQAHERPWRRRNPPTGWDSKRWDWMRSSSKP